jgi:hypothetical protein
MALRMYLRVNGMEISRAWVRNKLEDGCPFGRPEVVIEVPPTESLPDLGEIVLDENLVPGMPRFRAEVRYGDYGDWKLVTLQELVAILASGESPGQEVMA